MSNTYFYMRISTKEESARQSFQRQDKLLEKYAKVHNLKYTHRTVFRDDSSGNTFEREDWMELEKILKEGDTIVFKEISRFSREYKAGFEKYMELMDLGIELVFLDNPTVSTEYIKDLLNIANEQGNIAKRVLTNTIELLILVELDRAEKERETLIKRIKDGIKASGKKSGRAFGSLDKMTDELRADIQEYLEDRNITQADLVRKYKVSRNTMSKYIKKVKEDLERKEM